MTGVRIRDGEFEGICESCKEWLPMTTEFWPARQGTGLRRCRACVAEYHKMKARRGRVERKDLINAARRARYALLTPAQKQAKRTRDARYRERRRQRETS